MTSEKGSVYDYDTRLCGSNRAYVLVFKLSCKCRSVISCGLNLRNLPRGLHTPRQNMAVSHAVMLIVVASGLAGALDVSWVPDEGSTAQKLS